ncbi:nitrogen fixation protein NifX [Hydrococcus rivularis NIES-593]|uniref:Nitrogen fixation protein NifX n=1 Tax=Hydrococcus rivularis NIES-593 TaxID=1921803 RepID=A0A1U7HLI4_9CYAN|nr:nitrogen fixation protein NifX [Hydrococcus rivularis]OKH24453.1 nitrogen fixation protein NifX [Hydrococcus rivularis NIES-593]
MKVAFATSDNVRINSHFGSAQSIAVYDVSSEGYNFLETKTFGGNLDEDGNEDKLVPKVTALEGCTLVYVSSIGGSAASRLLSNKITPINLRSDETEIKGMLDNLVETLNGDPPPWLRKALQLQKPKSFDFEDED